MSDSHSKVKFCQKCNTDTSRDVNGKCKLCSANRKAAWLVANDVRAKEYAAAYRLKNVEKKKAYCSARYATNPKAKKSIKAWKDANPEAVRLNTQNRRARKRSNGGVLSAGLAKKLFKLQRGKCPCCGVSLGCDYHMDHIIPTSRGGLNIDENIQLLRSVCNLQKNAKDPIDFMQQRGFLL